MGLEPEISLQMAHAIGISSSVEGIQFLERQTWFEKWNGIGINHTILLVTADSPMGWAGLIGPTRKEAA